MIVQTDLGRLAHPARRAKKKHPLVRSAQLAKKKLFSLGLSCRELSERERASAAGGKGGSMAAVKDLVSSDKKNQ